MYFGVTCSCMVLSVGWWCRIFYFLSCCSNMFRYWFLYCWLIVMFLLKSMWCSTYYWYSAIVWFLLMVLLTW